MSKIKMEIKLKEKKIRKKNKVYNSNSMTSSFWNLLCSSMWHLTDLWQFVTVMCDITLTSNSKFKI